MKSESLNWIFYDARDPDAHMHKSSSQNNPDCQLRAWSKALDCDYAQLAKWLGLPSVDRKLDGKYAPYYQHHQWKKDQYSADQKKYDDYVAMNRYYRTTNEFPADSHWDVTFGRYLKDYRDTFGSGSHKFVEEHIDLDMWCLEHPDGTYVVGCYDPKNKHSKHVVAVIDGKFYDTWDSGEYVVDSWWQINTNKIRLDKTPKYANKKDNLFRKLREAESTSRQQYTKRQIQNAIAYWTKVLETI